jgi:hypothetical protein
VPESDGATLIVDEILAILTGSAEGQPPGRVLHVAGDGSTLFETTSIEMPYDAIRTFSSAENRRRVLRRMSRTAFSADSFFVMDSFSSRSQEPPLGSSTPKVSKLG